MCGYRRLMKAGDEDVWIYWNPASAPEAPSNILEQKLEHRHVYLGLTWCLFF